jgi:LIM domain kinase 1
VPPSFNIDKEDVQKMASPGAPADFIQLAIDCCAQHPADRPTTPQILSRLRVIEVEVLSRPSETDDLHVGSVKFFTGQKRPGAALRIPSFSAIRDTKEKKSSDSTPEGSDDEELVAAVMGLQSVTLEGEDDDDDDSTAWSEMTAKEGHFAGVKDSLQLRNGHARHGDGVSDVGEPLLAKNRSGSTLTYSDYSTSVIKAAGQAPPSLSSIMTVRPTRPASEEKIAIPSGPTDSMLSIDSFHTARSSFILGALSIAAATEGGSTIRRPEDASVMLHRFTLIKPGASGKKLPPGVSQGITSSASQGPSEAGWSPFDFFFSSGLVAKCDLCHKRLGWKPVLECDDCGLRCVTSPCSSKSRRWFADGSLQQDSHQVW